MSITDEYVRLEAENSKLRKLVADMWICLPCPTKESCLWCTYVHWIRACAILESISFTIFREGNDEVYPLLTFYRDGESFKVQCTACPVQCSTNSSTFKNALANLCCHSLSTIQRVMEGFDENDVHPHTGD